MQVSHYLFAIQLMAQNQTDSGESRLLALAPTRPLPKSLELRHLFFANSPGITEGGISYLTTIPKFNFDLNFFTPAFVLGTDQNYYLLNSQFEHQKFIEKRNQAEAELSNSNLNRVNPNQDFCQICKEIYLDYTSHIVSAAHRNRLKLSRAHAYIEDLCTSFKGPHQREEKCHHRKGKTRTQAPKGHKGKNNKMKESGKGEKNTISQASSSLTFPTLMHKEPLQ